MFDDLKDMVPVPWLSCDELNAHMSNASLNGP